MITTLTPEEKDLLDRVTLLVVGNGNTVSPAPFIPTPDEYAAIHKIRIKLGLNSRG